MAFRPERLSIHVASSQGILCTVRSKAYFGNRTQYLRDVDGISQTVVVDSPNNVQKLASGMEPGGKLWLSPDPGGGLLMPAG